MNVTPKDLLDAGVHFGHQTKRWNPRSKPYVFDHRQGITIIDLGKTHELLQKAYSFLEDTVAGGGNVLFVGTKRQAQEIVREAAIATHQPYAVDRWLGGTLTNFATVKKSMTKFKKFQQQESSGELAKLSSKEESAIKREMVRMNKNFSGIIELNALPSALFVVDANHEAIAVAEAKRLGIPCVGLVDTNSDPTQLAYPIPGNDDAVKSVRLIVDTIVEAIQNGLAQRESRRNTRGQADLRAVSSELAASSGAVNEEGEIDLSKVSIPSGIDITEADVAAAAAKKKAATPRKKVAAPKE
ncbi:MAG: 30S ribosomal protein S2 [Opitutaceae bacterium]|jgi:small subunit ribosomal protein S2